MKLAYQFQSAIFRQEQANGTRLNIGCFRSYPRIGVANPSKIMKQLLI